MLSPYIVNVSFAVGLRMSATAWMLKTLRVQICWLDHSIYARFAQQIWARLSGKDKIWNFLK